jgi:phospholipid/cholesterol/gamma-HCH transport system substrate-binding protein
MNPNLMPRLERVGRDAQAVSEQALGLLSYVGELSTLSGSLRQLTEQTRRDPRGLIFGRTPVPDGPGEAGAAR